MLPYRVVGHSSTDPLSVAAILGFQADTAAAVVAWHKPAERHRFATTPITVRLRSTTTSPLKDMLRLVPDGDDTLVAGSLAEWSTLAQSAAGESKAGLRCLSALRAASPALFGIGRGDPRAELVTSANAPKDARRLPVLAITRLPADILRRLAALPRVVVLRHIPRGISPLTSEVAIRPVDALSQHTDERVRSRYQQYAAATSKLLSLLSSLPGGVDDDTLGLALPPSAAFDAMLYLPRHEEIATALASMIDSATGPWRSTFQMASVDNLTR